MIHAYKGGYFPHSLLFKPRVVTFLIEEYLDGFHITVLTAISSQRKIFLKDFSIEQ